MEFESRAQDEEELLPAGETSRDRGRIVKGGETSNGNAEQSQSQGRSETVSTRQPEGARAGTERSKTPREGGKGQGPKPSPHGEVQYKRWVSCIKASWKSRAKHQQTEDLARRQESATNKL